MTSPTNEPMGPETNPVSSPSAGRWTHGAPPANVVLGPDTIVIGDLAFKRFHSKAERALVVGAHGTMDGVHFDLGEKGRMVIGDYCYFTNAILLCELDIRIGNYVVIGWNATVADTDFHPIGPAQRIADAIACSPLGGGRPRPEVAMKPVVVEDNVWIGPNVTILKGVRLGAGAFVEAGSLVTRDVPAGARVLGNPAKVIGEVS